MALVNRRKQTPLGQRLKVAKEEKPPEDKVIEPDDLDDDDEEPTQFVSMAVPTGTSAIDNPEIPEHWKPRPIEDRSRLAVLEDTQAQKQIQAILKRLDTDGVSLDDTVALLVRSFVDSSLDFGQVHRAFKQAMLQVENRMEVLMVSQAMKHVAAEVDSAKLLDTLQEELVAIVRTPAVDPKIKVSAFNAMVKYRDSKVDFSLKVVKLLQDTKLVDRVADIFQTFVRMAESGGAEWEPLLEGMPVEERRDMALIVKWMMKAEGMDFQGIAAYLEQR